MSMSVILYELKRISNERRPEQRMTVKKYYKNVLQPIKYTVCREIFTTVKYFVTFILAIFICFTPRSIYIYIHTFMYVK